MSQEGANEKSGPAPAAVEAKKRPLNSSAQRADGEPETKTKTTDDVSRGKVKEEVPDEGKDKVKWHSLEHHGVQFMDTYTPFGLALKIKVLSWIANEDRARKHR